MRIAIIALIVLSTFLWISTIKPNNKCNCIGSDSSDLVNESISYSINEHIKNYRKESKNTIKTPASDLFLFVSGEFMFINSNTSMNDIEEIIKSNKKCTKCIEQALTNNNIYYLIINENGYIYRIQLDKRNVLYLGEYNKWYSIDNFFDIEIGKIPSIKVIE